MDAETATIGGDDRKLFSEPIEPIDDTPLEKSVLAWSIALPVQDVGSPQTDPGDVATDESGIEGSPQGFDFG